MSGSSEGKTTNLLTSPQKKNDRVKALYSNSR